jgi:hypothetical protein
LGDEAVTPDPIRSFIVSLADGTEQTDADAIAAAIRLFKGVVSVQPLRDHADMDAARASIDAEWRQRIVGLLDDEGV